MKEPSNVRIAIKYIVKAILFCGIFTALLIIFSSFKSLIPGKYERLAHGIIGTTVALLTTFLFLRLDKKSFSDYGLRIENSTLKNGLIGFLIGIGLMGLMATSVIYFSDFKVEINKNSSFLSFLFWTFPLIPLAFMEEVAFRGYPLVVLRNKAGVRASIFTGSILFALYHIANGWTVADSFLGPGVWGIIFGLTAVYSKGIAMPTGLHFATNLTTAAFGISDNSFNIWTLRQKDGSTLDGYQASQMTTLIPQIALLVFGIVLLEWFSSKKSLVLGHNDV